MLAAALQSKSPERSLTAPLSNDIQTILSPQAVPTIQSRTKCEFAAAAPMAAFTLLTTNVELVRHQTFADTLRLIFQKNAEKSC
jgi:hypothetical protein